MLQSKEQHYVPLVQGDDTSGQIGKIQRRTPLITIFLSICCAFLLVVVAAQSFFIYRIDHYHGTAGFLPIETVSRVLNVHSNFDSEYEDVSAAAWDSIEAGHGDVAIDPLWAEKQGLPPSVEHPLVPGKSLYILEAYHAIHCLKVLRDHYMAMYSPSPSSLDKSQWPLEHDVHCFDSLRQHIMCHADDTLLYTTNHHDAGVHQTKQCRSWDALRDWATENSAHWKDHINPNPNGEFWWNFDDGGDDGLPRGSLS